MGICLHDDRAIRESRCGICDGHPRACEAYKLDLGETHRNAIADGAHSPSKTGMNALIAWTEQPGSRTPFVGAVQRGTGYFFVSMSALESMTAGHDDLRNDFLTMAGSVRRWGGR